MNPWFATISSLLRENGVARPCLLVDLDRLDHNIDLLNTTLGPPFHFRLVTKSLPCGELMRYILGKTGSNRIMAFHSPWLVWLTANLPEVDILMGKPLLQAAVEEFYRNTEDPVAASSQIQWLVDTPERLGALGEFSKGSGLRLRISIEIDIGLGRGGVMTRTDLQRLLTVFNDYPDHLVLSGYMGYDAHVPFVQGEDPFGEAMEKYSRWIDDGARFDPVRYSQALTFNSGGSRTWQKFQGKLPVNDVSVGSALLRPSRFSELEDHQPALFIATPVIKRFKGPDRSGVKTHYYLYGGGWAADILWPETMVASPLADPPNENLLPNQSLYHSTGSCDPAIGDYVFFQPRQSDAMFQFEDILVISGGRIIDYWKPLPLRY